MRTIDTRTIHGTRHNILGTPPIKRSTKIDSSIKEFSVRFSQFKELSETLQFILYPDVISFDKMNLPQLDWLEIEEFEMQFLGF
ncbi:dimer_Tnp_hAT domain-containing protein [Trichonephila clavipes]|nr:dimer_Tnp_hAT domain-containing protein [Trichonephila clavipes]